MRTAVNHALSSSRSKKQHRTKLLIRHIETEIGIEVSVAGLSAFGILLFKNAHLLVSHMDANRPTSKEVAKGLRQLLPKRQGRTYG